MSIRANPTSIGLFLVGAIVIAVAGTAMLAGQSWFRNKTTFVSYFRESVNGLEDGAPVKFQGAPVGKVTKMLIQIDEHDKTFQVPVEYEIDIKRLRTEQGTYVDLGEDLVLKQQIANGLRAQLQMESIVTGQLYIELSYSKDVKPPKLEPRETLWPEIPTTPSLMAALGTDAGSIVADMVKVLYKVNEMLAAIDMPAINKAVVGSAQSVQRLVDAPELRATLKELPAMTAQLSRTLARVDTLAATAGAAIDPMAGDLKSATKEMNATMLSLHRTIDDAHGMLSTDSGIGYGLQEALVNLTDATSALRRLLNALEQNPDMLLRGKKPPEKR
ncbi:MAG: MCE family protein [Gemmatimonadetes bacterium]|nr:MCE family protein [Gemmatimonadota bacterium]